MFHHIYAGHLLGCCPFEPSRLQQGEGREHGQDEEEKVPAESGRHLRDQEGGKVAELQGGETEEGALGDHDRHLHEQHPTTDPQVTQPNFTVQCCIKSAVLRTFIHLTFPDISFSWKYHCLGKVIENIIVWEK